MKKTLYCPDIECDSCIKILSRVLKKTEGVSSYSFNADSIELDFDVDTVSLDNIKKAIGDKGYRVSEEQFYRMRTRDRAKEFVKDRKKYALEYKLLKNIGLAFVLLLVLDLLVIFWRQSSNSDFIANYAWWIFYLTISVIFIAGAIWHFKSYKTTYTCMIGMMIGMTVGMQSGMMIGYILGVTNGFFVGALTGMVLASIVGAYCGKVCCGIMGGLEGMMAGVMGGTMGPMLSVMMFNDNILWFTPVYMLFNIIILGGFSYMIFEEVVEDNAKIVKSPIKFRYFLFGCLLLWAIPMAILVFAPPSIFLG